MSTSISKITSEQQQQQQQQNQSTTATCGFSVIAPQPLSPIPKDITIPQGQQITSSTPAPAAGGASSTTDGKELATYVPISVTCKLYILYYIMYLGKEQNTERELSKEENTSEHSQEGNFLV